MSQQLTLGPTTLFAIGQRKGVLCGLEIEVLQYQNKPTLRITGYGYEIHAGVSPIKSPLYLWGMPALFSRSHWVITLLA